MRIKNLFAASKAFIGYLTVGDGGLQRSLAVAHALIAGGVNMLELGVPFSDPIADGPVIQRAAQRALTHHTTLHDVLNLAADIRQEFSGPIILFSYFNPLLRLNPSLWLSQAKACGIDGVLVVDLPYEEAHEFYCQCLEHDLLPISVITPATEGRRLQNILQQAQGFLYYACRTGTTGIKTALPDDFYQKMLAIKTQTSLPVVAGFGIANSQDAKKVLQHADGFVVGSLFMQALESGVNFSTLTQLARSLCY